jgi:DNA modification methylase
LGDSTKDLKLLYDNCKVDLIFTSPPYYGVTNYHVDQWLRLWVLGGLDKPITLSEKHKGRFNSMPEYENLINSVFSECARMLSEKGVIYVRTDYRKFTLDVTKSALKKYFPNHRMSETFNRCSSKSQTELLNNTTEKVCEVDLLLKP